MKKKKKISSILSIICIMAMIAQIIMPSQLVFGVTKSYYLVDYVNGLQFPEGVAVDSEGNLYIADFYAKAIKKVDTAGNVTIFASDLQYPTGLDLDSEGNLYIAEYNSNKIKKIDTAGNITTLVETGLSGPVEVKVDNEGNLYITDSYNGSIKKRDLLGNVTTVISGLSWTFGVALDSEGNVYASDYNNNLIKKLDTLGNVTTVVSTGLLQPRGVAIDSNGNLYIADAGTNSIKKMDTMGNLTTLVSSGLNYPAGIALDDSGNLYIANRHNNGVKKLLWAAEGLVSDFANISKTSSKATFTWTNTISSTDISIEQSIAGENAWTTANTAVINKNATKATVTGLKSNTEYDFRLVVTGGPNAGTSNTVTIITEELPAPILMADITESTNKEVTVTIDYSADATIKLYKTNNGDWTNYLAPIVVSENDTISAKYQDIAGNWSEVSEYSVTNIDRISPEAANLTADVVAATNGKVKITIDYAVDAVVKKYSLDGINYIDYTGEIELSENGTIYAKSQDAAGNWSEVSEYNLTNIDKTSPEAANLTADVIAATNGNVKVTIDYAVDAAVKKYSLDGINYMDYTGEIELSENGTIYAKSQDAAGNWSTVSEYKITNIDKTSPEAANLKADVVAATNGKVKVTIDYAVDAVVKKYSLDGINYMDYTGEIELSENGTIYAKSQDIAGNWSEVSEYNVTNIDKTSPEAANLKADVVATTNGKVKVTINYAEDAVVKLYSLDGINYMDYTGEIEFSENGTVYAKSQDAAGNWSTVSEYKITNIEKTEQLVKPEQSTKPEVLVQTGSVIGGQGLTIAGIVFLLTGLSFVRKKRA